MHAIKNMIAISPPEMNELRLGELREVTASTPQVPESALWPVVLAAHLRLRRHRAAETGTSTKFDAADLAALHDAVTVAEPTAPESLRLGLVLACLDEERTFGTTTAFEKASACMDADLRTLRGHPAGTTTLPIVAHLGLDETQDIQPMPRDQSELVLVCTHSGLATVRDLLPTLCREVTECMQSADEGDVDGFARGVFFSDAELGVACLATSLLTDLGASVTDDGEFVAVGDQAVDEFFDVAFLGSRPVG